MVQYEWIIGCTGRFSFDAGYGLQRFARKISEYRSEMKKARIFIIVLVLLSGLVFGGCNMFFSENHVSVKGQKLNRYVKSSGGDMTGGYESVTIKRMDDQYALYTVEKAEWHFQDPEVREYYIDVKVLDDIRNVVVDNKINNWNRKKFTNMFISDGASYSYNFSFDESTVSFSSQYYPDKYSKKLELIDAAVEPYTQAMVKLPGLVVPGIGGDDKYIPAKEAVGIYACRYSGNQLCYKVVNDTDSEVEYSYQPVIRRLTDDVVLYRADEQNDSAVYAHSDDIQSFTLKERLTAGTYELNIGDYSCTFTIED